MARNLAPLAAPFLVLLCAPRWELAAVAACWSALIVPGVLAIDPLFPGDHPLGRHSCRFAVATVVALLPFGLVSWTGCLFSWTLPDVLTVYGGLYLACTAGLVGFRVWGAIVPRQSRSKGALSSEPAAPELALSGWTAAAAIAGIALVMGGMVWSVAETPAQGMTRVPFPGREHWWRGTVLATAGSLIAAVALAWGGRSTRTKSSRYTLSGKAFPRVRAQAPDKSPNGTAAGWATGLLWLVAAGLTLYVMKAAYALPHPDARREAWNSDDVTYVAEALDYRYGSPLGRYEPTLGTNLPMSPVNLSPLIAPLVAALARISGVDCAAIQHSVLCPLIVLAGMSALAAALHVVFRSHSCAVPLGLVVILLMICKSWDYERSMVEFTVWRAMQTKSVHLWLIHPLQLATLLLLTARPDWRHLFMAIAVAIVGHLAHPFSTILGAVWSGILLAYEGGALVLGTRSDRGAAGHLLVILACYAALGGAFRAHVWSRPPEVGPSSGRVEGEPEQSRDLVRVDDQPIPRQEPRVLFGYDVLFNLGAVSLPILLAGGLRRREWLYVGLFGAVAVALCTLTPLGRLLNLALPTSIFWRARWMLPSLVCIAAVALVLHEALSVLIRRIGGVLGPLSSPAAALLVLAAFAGMLSRSQSVLVKVGPMPGQLSKFSLDMYGLVDPLGGREASPFVWGTREVTRELPQLMPNIKLVLSREKIMLPADHPSFRDVVLEVREKFRRDTLTQDDLQLLLKLYAIDHIVLDQPGRDVPAAVGLLRDAGWKEVGWSGRYHVWRKKTQ